MKNYQNLKTNPMNKKLSLRKMNSSKSCCKNNFNNYKKRKKILVK